jgi:competence protein ComEC
MSVKFHFLNVGCGDCTIIHFPARTLGEQKIDERIMMIDLYTHEDHDSFEDIVAYYKINFKNQDGTIKPIFRFVCSHPHQDHICGLEKLFNDNHKNS